jgi:hypothetical protein
MPRPDPHQKKGTKNKKKLDGKTDLDKLHDLSSMKYQHQAKWILNAFWSKPLNATAKAFKDNAEMREKVFEWCQFFAKLDPDSSQGCDLIQQKAHQFLEKQTEACTWLDLKDKMKTLDADHNMRLSLAEYLVHHFKLDVKYLVNVVANVDAAYQAKLDACQAKMEAAEVMHEEQVAALEDTLRISAEIKAFKAALQKDTERLQKIIDDETVSNVKRMKAKHELNDVISGARAKRKGIKGKDPDFLKVAKIKQAAAVRREKKATKAAAAALKEASAEFDILSQVKGVASQGTLWWMGRDLEFMKKYMSQKEYARKQKKLSKKTNATAAE